MRNPIPWLVLAAAAAGVTALAVKAYDPEPVTERLDVVKGAWGTILGVNDVHAVTVSDGCSSHVVATIETDLRDDPRELVAVLREIVALALYGDLQADTLEIVLTSESQVFFPDFLDDADSFPYEWSVGEHSGIVVVLA